LLHEKKSLFSLAANKKNIETLKEQRRKEEEDEQLHMDDNFFGKMAKKAVKFVKRMGRRLNNSRKK